MSNTSPRRGQSHNPKVVRGSRQKRLLSESMQLEEEAVPQFMRPALVLIALLVVAGIVWSAMVQMDEVSSASGEVVPSGSLKVVQHPDGGIVTDILVEERELVEAGQPLLRLDAGQADANLNQIKSRMASLRLRAERLRAFAEGREPDFWSVTPDYPQMIADQNEIWRSQEAERRSSLEVLDTQIEQRERELIQTRDALEAAKRQQQLTAELLALRTRLAQKQLISQVVLLETKRAAATAEGEVQRLESDVAVREQALAETTKRRENLESSIQQDALAELGTVEAETAEARSALERAQLISDRLEVRAPVRGLVQDLQVSTEGEVVRSSQILMHIVPVTDTLEAEVRIPPRDIGHLQPGQPVTVKVTSYSYARFGSVNGKLRQVSASSVMDENNQPYFRGWVTLQQNYVGSDEGRYPVLPGMTVQADIVTGEKTLLQYILKPISDAVSTAFRER